MFLFLCLVVCFFFYLLMGLFVWVCFSFLRGVGGGDGGGRCPLIFCCVCFVVAFYVVFCFVFVFVF